MDQKLTPSQQKAYEKLGFYFRIGAKNLMHPMGIKIRATPMIVGASGSGKTFLVSKLAEEHEIAMFPVNITNWIVIAAKGDLKYTMHLLGDFVKKNEKGIIFIDELNKLKKAHAATHAWSADVFTEVIALLDRDDRLETMGFEGVVGKLRSNFMFVGAAAFHDEWIDSARQNTAMGFGALDESDAGQVERFTTAIREQSGVPEELLNRFNDTLIAITPPEKEEYVSRIPEIREYYRLPALESEELDRLAQSAVDSNKVMRWLEGYATECLNHISSERMEEITLQSGYTSTPVSSSSGSSSADWNLKRSNCWDDYATACKELSSSARRLSVLLEGAVIASEREKHIAGSAEFTDYIVKKFARIGINTTELENMYGGAGIPSLCMIADKSLGISHRFLRNTDTVREAQKMHAAAKEIFGELPLIVSMLGGDISTYSQRIIAEVLEFARICEVADLHKEEFDYAEEQMVKARKEERTKTSS